MQRASGEPAATFAGIRATIAARVSVVIAKSVNEPEAAKRQIHGARYTLLDPEMVARMEAAGLHLLELNVSALHAEEAVAGTIRLEREPERIVELTDRIRRRIHIPLLVKLSGQASDVLAEVDAARRGGADAVVLMGDHLGFMPDIKRRWPLMGPYGAAVDGISDGNGDHRRSHRRRAGCQDAPNEVGVGWHHFVPPDGPVDAPQYRLRRGRDGPHGQVGRSPLRGMR
jgi:hypothetical protein